MVENKWHGKKVLIVDDSPEVRGQLREIFTQLEFEVVGEAGNGIEALGAIDSLEPDLVSLDIIMPEMDGMECFQFIKKKYPNVECIFVSILSSDSRVYDAYNDEIEQYRFVGKPVTINKIKFALENIYENYQGGEAMEEIDGADEDTPSMEDIAPKEA